METSQTYTALESISNALNQGIEELGAFSIVIAAVIIITILLPIIIRIKNRKKTTEAAEASYQKLIRKHNLTILELDLIDKLAETQKRSEDRYQLIVMKNVLNSAVKKAEPLSDIEHESLEQLKIRLGFMETPEEPLGLSTKTMPQGLPIKMKYEGSEYTDAEIYSVSETNITVKFQGIHPELMPDQQISIFSPIGGKIRCYRLLTDKVREEVFTAEHTETEAFDNLNVKIDITVKKSAKNTAEDTDQKINETYYHEGHEKPKDKQTSFKSLIALLKQRGAFIVDKNSDLEPEDRAELFFSNDKKGLYPIPVSVIKVSEQKKLASVMFLNIE